MSKRSNPATGPQKRVALSESVVHPVATAGSVGPGLGKKGNLPKKPAKGMPK